MITHVAIIYKCKIYSLPAPNRHHNVIREIAKENGVGIKSYDIQGFINDQGDFLTRRQGMQYARSCGQLNRKDETGSYQGDELYSEDLW